jgi:hypothetical protein
MSSARAWFRPKRQKAHPEAIKTLQKGESPKQVPIVKQELEGYSLELVGGKIPLPWDMDWGYNWNMAKEK